MAQTIMSTTIVRIAVARFELIFHTPNFAKIAVSDAKMAASIAYIHHMARRPL